LGFPLLCLVLRSREALLTALLAIFASGPFYRANHQDLYDYLACFDQIALGCITAIGVQAPLLQKFVRRRGFRPILLLTGLGLVFGTYCYKIVDANLIFGPTGIALGMACLLMYSGSTAAMPGKRHSRWWLIMAMGAGLLGLMGRISYEIYLTHGMVIRYMMARSASLSAYFASCHISNPSFFFMMLIFPMILLLGLLFGNLYTNPVNHYLRKFFSTTTSVGSLPASRLARPAPAGGATRPPME